MKTVVISGANRGIGLALAELYIKNEYRVIATARNLSAANELKNLADSADAGQLILEPLDVSSDSSVGDFWGRLENYDCVDILINNAGMLVEYGAGAEELNLSEVEKTFNVNTLGPMRMVQAGIQKLKKSNHAKIINVSSKVGSLKDNGSGFGYAYRMSKCALNMYTKNLSIEYPNIISASFHPGWVQTDMGGASAPTSTQESASGMYTIINSLSSDQSGSFLDFRGQSIPW